MNFQHVMIAKRHFEGLIKLCDTIDEKGLWDKRGIDISLSKVFRTDIAQYMLYLSAADGRLSPDEAQAFRTITGFNDSADTLIDVIKNQNIYSTDFESTVPLSLKIITEAERNLISYGVKLNSEKTTQELFVEFFELLGEVVLNSDGGVTYNEKRDLNIYMSTLKQYVRENSNSMRDYYRYLGE